MSSETILCPSSRCKAGAVLLGIIMPDGRVAFSSDRIVVDREFVQIANEGRSPEKRFRFSSPCVTGGCKQWTGDKCGVIEVVMDALVPCDPVGDLPACSIRNQCRWFFQAGAAACIVCPLVVTDARVDREEYQEIPDALEQECCASALDREKPT